MKGGRDSVSTAHAGQVNPVRHSVSVINMEAVA